MCNPCKACNHHAQGYSASPSYPRRAFLNEYCAGHNMACDVMRSVLCVLICGEGNLAMSQNITAITTIRFCSTVNNKDRVSTKQVFIKTVLRTKPTMLDLMCFRFIIVHTCM